MNTSSYLAQAYGSGTYACGEFGEGCTPQETNPGTSQDGGVLAPLTGFLAQPAYIVYPTLLGLAIIIGTISYLIAKKLRKN